jgi:hypothetical protein
MATKINIRSPYYLKYTDAALTKVSIKLFVYQGTETTDKGIHQYELTNDVIDGTDYVVFEVAEFVRDYFNFEFDGSNYTSNTQWLRTEATLYNDDVIIREEINSYLAFDGYTEFTDGLNAEGSRAKLMTADTVIIPEGETQHIGVYSEDVLSVTLYRYVTGATTSNASWNTESRQWNVNTDFWADEATSTPEVITDTATLSQGKIQYFAVDNQTGLIEVNTASESKILVVKPAESCLYGHRKITFINKHGAYQDFFFMGTQRETVTYDSSSYKASKIDFANMNYSMQSGQDKRFDVNSSKVITLNTGWIVEDLNSALEEMLMSESVWITENGNTVPVIPVNETLEKKTRLIEGLINYEIAFKYAFNNNNTVI